MTLPDGFIKMLDDLGADYAALADTLTDTNPEVAIRINRAKVERYGSQLKVAEDSSPVAWCRDGYVLPSRPAFTLDPALHQGLYYVQDASSMAISAAVERAVELIDVHDRPVRYLDACAAPGGKTTAAISMLPRDAFVVANEFDPRRASILCENLAKWGSPAVVTVGNAADPWHLPGFFDIIAADVPCSGEGMMRKDPQAIQQWTPGLVNSCAKLQIDIVDSLWEALTPGGIFIYSTCTFNPTENEAVVAHLIDTFEAIPLEIQALQTPGVLGAHAGYLLPVYHFLPGKVAGEGQFLAMLRKPLTGAGGRVRMPKIAVKSIKTDGWLNGDYVYTQDNNGVITAIPNTHQQLVAAVAATRHIRWSGIEVATVKGRDYIPSHELAMALDSAEGCFPTMNVDRDTALDYLRRLSVTLPSDAPRGHVLLTFDNAPLGFIKNLGNRSNNLYPSAWRILK